MRRPGHGCRPPGEAVVVVLGDATGRLRASRRTLGSRRAYLVLRASPIPRHRSSSLGGRRPGRARRQALARALRVR